MAVAQAPKPLRPEQAAFVRIAKQNVVRDFRDPTVQYRDVFIAGSAHYMLLCGEVNGKNVYGGYVGFTPFIASRDKEMTMVGGDAFKPHLLQKAKDEACKNKIIDVE